MISPNFQLFTKNNNDNLLAFPSNFDSNKKIATNSNEQQQIQKISCVIKHAIDNVKLSAFKDKI